MSDILQDTLDHQRRAFLAAPAPPAEARRESLRRLKAAVQAHQGRLAAAMSADFGRRSTVESRMADVMGPVLEINHALRHLGRWMKPSRRSPELLFLGNATRVVYQPKGVVGIIAPWNFPVYLALGPLVAALAAGNRAMIKMSEFTPRTTEAVATLLADCFDADEVAVFGGDVAVGRAFSHLPFDHLVFTGSPAVGREVMRAAAEHLVPVTLELGGKSPAIVSRSADLATAARRIVHGKAFNGGQICVSPDYALVPREQVETFCAAAGEAFRAMYPDPLGDPDYTSLVSERHAERIRALLADARDKGARVQACGPTDSASRAIPLHLVSGVTPDMRVAREELFGPILPVLPYDAIDEAIAHVNAGERPLALYWFGRDRGESRRVMDATHSGGVTLNDWGWHVFQHDMPFGGIGNSGMGSYHGIEGFRELSHARAIFDERPFFPVGLFHPPYGNLVQRLALRFFLGKERDGV